MFVYFPEDKTKQTLAEPGWGRGLPDVFLFIGRRTTSDTAAGFGLYELTAVWAVGSRPRLA